MSEVKEIVCCRSCGRKALTPLFSLGVQAVSDFVEESQIKNGIKCPLDLVLCEQCGLVQLKHTAPQQFLYTHHYWYKSGTTQTMKDALADVVRAATEKVILKPGDVVLDIGSNDGTLLRNYPGWVVKVGVEPAENLAAEGKKGVDFLVNDFWEGVSIKDDTWTIDDHTHGFRTFLKAKIITACGMFYDLDDPNQFIADVAKVLAPDGVFVAQLQCLKQTLELGDVGNFAHEHLEFYSLYSLEKLFNRHGLAIFDVMENDVNGGSYRLFVGHTSGFGAKSYFDDESSYERVTESYQRERKMGLLLRSTYTEFFHRILAQRDKVRDFVREKVAEGKTVWVYGSSTKGNVLLQWYNLPYPIIQAAADKSPEKWGKYTIETGIPIKSEQEFREANPDFALVLPYSFLPEFREREKDWLRGGGKFIVPLPEPRIIAWDGGELL